MFLSILAGSNEIIHEGAHMVGFNSAAGMRAVYIGHQNFSMSIPENLLFVLMEDGHYLYSIGNSFVTKKKENIYIITNCVDRGQKYKIQSYFKETWLKKYNKYRQTWMQQNWFEDNIEQAKSLINKHK